MIKHLFKIAFFVISMGLIGVSCTEEIDLDQVNDLEINPVLESSLFYFEAAAGDFFLGGSGAYTAGDYVVLDIFDNEFVNDNLIKAELVFETVNSINRAYQVQVDFLDNTNTLRHSFTFSADASPNNENLTFEHIEVFEDETLENLKETTTLVFRLTMLPGAPVDPNSPGSIHLKSKGVFYLNIDR
ncbi:hypothetical protein GCM10022291_29250 [Postechiella marina]|uniref:Uncharacterized protein n=1 Tax=Postechiella marina TaxID=943941 RepID=A0ABP8CF28_9FLAO